MPSVSNPARWLLGITGASGALYAARFLHSMHSLHHPVDVMVSACGKDVLDWEGQAECLKKAATLFANDDLFAAPASGSSYYAGMAVIPCTMGTIGRLASGSAETLLLRAADVCLKERRPLVLVPREMPLSRIHLENLLRLEEAGARIVPACPSFYHHPRTIEEVADTVVAKVLDQLGIPHKMQPQWGKL
ncbi:MAG TPA: UbiX family flavin prenyltransferase [Fibrobacteraceae bacterium]|nr:UbiX family flavin prenyltransferase [Fibrobacteraceae bacterium]